MESNTAKPRVVWIAENVEYDDLRIVSETDVQSDESWAVPDRIMSYAGFNLYRAELHKDVRKDWDSQQIIRNQYEAHHAQQLRAAVEAERAAVMAYLRRQGGRGCWTVVEAISRGEHRLDEETP
jgi:hypothetical protein